MSPSISFFKFLANDIIDNNFHHAYSRLPEAMRLLEKMSPEERELCVHTIEGARKIHTRDFRKFNQFVKQMGKKPQFIAAFLRKIILCLAINTNTIL